MSFDSENLHAWILFIYDTINEKLGVIFGGTKTLEIGVFEGNYFK